MTVEQAGWGCCDPSEENYITTFGLRLFVSESATCSDP